MHPSKHSEKHVTKLKKYLLLVWKMGQYMIWDEDRLPGRENPLVRGDSHTQTLLIIEGSNLGHSGEKCVSSTTFYFNSP